MTKLCFLFLFLVAEAWGTLESRNGDLDPKNLLKLLDRMEKLESVVLEQRAMLKQQEQKLTRQGNLLRQQAATIFNQDLQLRQHSSELTRQQSLNRRQDSRLLALEILRHQSNHQLPSHESVIPQQDRATSQPRDLVRTLSDDALNRPGAALHDSVTENTSLEKETSDPPAQSSTGRDGSSDTVAVRSDDQGPLEVVVTRLSQQVSELTADVQTLKNDAGQQDLHIQDARSSTFVQWGSSQCSDSSQLVYSGVVGGSYSGHTGAATNFLCLTLSPVFSSVPATPDTAYLYGGEYHVLGPNYLKDAVCSVCRASFSTTIMIPGTNVCRPGWHLQYSGFLMAGKYQLTAGTQYICVDSRLQSRMGGDAQGLGMLLYYTVTRCGSLPCGPYINDRTVTCAVCSK